VAFGIRPELEPPDARPFQLAHSVITRDAGEARAVRDLVAVCRLGIEGEGRRVSTRRSVAKSTRTTACDAVGVSPARVGAGGKTSIE
jgi:hypothetical protein